MYDQQLNLKGAIHLAAMMAHQANAAYCRSIGDNSQPEWSDAPDWQRKSAINGMTATVEGRINSPEDSHISWMKEKEDDGWVYGEVKDPEKKTHPCMVPYDELPEEQRVKDDIFHSIARALKAEIASSAPGA